MTTQKNGPSGRTAQVAKHSVGGDAAIVPPAGAADLDARNAKNTSFAVSGKINLWMGMGVGQTQLPNSRELRRLAERLAKKGGAK